MNTAIAVCLVQVAVMIRGNIAGLVTIPAEHGQCAPAPLPPATLLDDALSTPPDQFSH